VQLLGAGRNVVAAVRSQDKAEVFEEMGLDGATGTLFVKAGVDITDAATLSDGLLEGVTQIVSAVGPVFGRTPEGQMGCAFMCCSVTNVHQRSSIKQSAVYLDPSAVSWQPGSEPVATGRLMTWRLKSCGLRRYLDNMTSERVDAQGVSNIAQLAQQLPAQRSEAVQILGMSSAEDMKVFVGSPLSAFQCVQRG